MRRSLDRLRLVLDAADRRPTSVGLLPDRSSRILGLAAARLLGLPAEPFAPGRPGVLAVAYDLNETDAEGLWERAEGQVLFEHATCWTDPPAVSADVTGLLHQVVKAPWGEQLRFSPSGETETVPPDERPVEELAEEIVRADPHEPDDGADDGAPPDPDELLAGFARAAAAGGSAARGTRCIPPGRCRAAGSSRRRSGSPGRRAARRRGPRPGRRGRSRPCGTDGTPRPPGRPGRARSSARGTGRRSGGDAGAQLDHDGHLRVERPGDPVLDAAVLRGAAPPAHPGEAEDLPGRDGQALEPLQPAVRALPVGEGADGPPSCGNGCRIS
ncbi:hypothetical protein [Actinomadura madurae]|uniref:hypothetical protein n=1 Tax=Actinomadura madurae TaxID=1993 RepID=UPI0020D22DD4|nr:hypothetical protein [Actinomadura madurae]MCQ0014008.1 hypothetical protein [Actinomadura madurae]